MKKLLIYISSIFTLLLFSFAIIIFIARSSYLFEEINYSREDAINVAHQMILNNAKHHGYNELYVAKHISLVDVKTSINQDNWWESGEKTYWEIEFSHHNSCGENPTFFIIVSSHGYTDWAGTFLRCK